MIPAVVLIRQDHTNVMSVDSVGSGSEAESLSSLAEMDIIDQSDSSSRLDVSSAACVSNEGDTTSSMDMPIVMASVPSQGQTEFLTCEHLSDDNKSKMQHLVQCCIPVNQIHHTNYHERNTDGDLVTMKDTSAQVNLWHVV